jgi:hypothetical protein
VTTPAQLLDRLAQAGRILFKGGFKPAPTRSRSAIPPITAEEVAEARQFFPLEKFFIFGHARSGTTLLARLVRLHPAVHCNWQAHFFTRPPLLQALVADQEVGNWLARRSNRWNQGRDLSPLVLRVVSDFILERQARPLGKTIVGDKSPNSLLNGEAVRLLQAVYPEARLIFIVRDGRDAAVSHRFQSFIDSVQHLGRQDLSIRAEFARNPEPFLHGQRSLFTPRGLRIAAESWVRNVCETHQLGQELFGARYLCLQYEDLVRAAWEKMSQVWSFLGASATEPELEEALASELSQNPDKEWQLEKAGEIAGAVHKGQQGSWRQLFTPADMQAFHEIAGETLAQWGYRL